MKTPLKRWLAISVVCLLLIGLVVWLNLGYGLLSEQSYPYALALISACVRQDENRIQHIAQEISQRDLPKYDRRVIQQIVDTAMNGDWEQAASEARELLKAQVKTTK